MSRLMYGVESLCSNSFLVQKLLWCKKRLVMVLALGIVGKAVFENSSCFRFTLSRQVFDALA